MSRILFIRVSAASYDEADVKKAWPSLCSLVWSHDDSPTWQHGVLELATSLVDAVHFKTLSSDALVLLLPAAQNLEVLTREMGVALGDQNVSEAKKLADAIEKSLDEAEILGVRLV